MPYPNSAVAAPAPLGYGERKAPVAQLDRALPSEGRGQKFESSRARQFLPHFCVRSAAAFSLSLDQREAS